MESAYKRKLSLETPQGRKTLGKAILRLQDNWKFTNTEMARLIGVKPNTFGGWKQKKEIPFKKAPLFP